MVFTKAKRRVLANHFGFVKKKSMLSNLNGAEAQNRTADTSLFRAVLYQLSYLGTAI